MKLANEIAESSPLAVMSTRETMRRFFADGAEIATERELVEQENTRLGSERNAQRMLDRIEPYQKKVKLHEDNIANLQKELANLR